MGLDRPIDITAEQRKIVTDLLERHLPDTAAWIYGSRVKWTARPQSDLDMVVFATPEQNGRVSDLRETFEESNLPFRVDLFVWDAVPEQFRKQIKSEHVVLVESGARDLVGEWPTDRFGRLLTEPVRNGIYKRKEFHGRGAKIVNMGELFAHPRLRAVPMKRLELSESENDRFLITAGDLLFARRSLVAEGAGKCCAVLNVDEPTTFESSIIRARPDPTRADYLYLYYFFNSALGLYHLDTIRRQVAVAGITGSDLTNLDIPVPPLPEQRAIAHILGTLDDKIELNRRMNATLEAMARALFKSWFVDFDPVRAKMAGRDTGLPKHLANLFPDRLVDSELGEIPEGWEVKSLDEIAVFQNGLALQKHRPQQNEERLPVVKIAQLRSGQADSREWAFANIKPECIINDGDIVFSWSGSLMVTIWCGGQAALNQHLFKVTSTQFPKWFCLYCTESHLPDFRRIASGKATTMGHIKRHHLTDAKCVVPTWQIFSSVDNTFSSLLSKTISLSLEPLTLAALRDTLLHKLVSGELRVVDNCRPY